MRIINKTVWINFLHMYQPPWQQRGVIEQVAIESYEYIATLLTKYQNYKITLNITGSLIEQLADIRPDLLIRFQKLINQKQIELTGSAQYHPLLPLLPLAEAKRQIELNQATLTKYFKIKKLAGFYLPEMAFSLPIAKLVKTMGFEWLILDPIHYNGQINQSVLYQLKGVGLKILFRDRQISKDYPPKFVYQSLQKNQAQIIISATDAEIYGHHHEDWQGFVEKIFKYQNLQTLTISEYLKTLHQSKMISLRPATWETTASELKKKLPFVMWLDPQNSIHRSLWQLVNLAINLVNKYKQDQNWFWARQHLDRSLSSCTFWWATAKKLSPFSPVAWNPDMIDHGSEELIRSIRSLNQASSSEKIKAEKIYLQIKKDTWLNHWQKYNKK